MTRVSVIMPLFNGEPYVASAIDSVQAQAIDDLELIVVNDGSTDGGEQRVTAAGGNIKLLNQTNLGPAAARNRGLEIAAGTFIAFVDADDLWPPGRLQWQLEQLTARADIDIVQGQLQELHPLGDDWALRGEPLFAHHLGTALYRREVFDQVGPLDESLPYCEDVDWFLAAERAGVAIQRREQVCMWYRRHGYNLTQRRDLIRQYTLRVVAKHWRKTREAAR